MQQSVLSVKCFKTPLRERATVVATVVLIHAAFFLAWLIQPSNETPPVGEMSVQVSLQADTVQAAVRPSAVKVQPIPDEMAEPDKPKQSEPETSPVLSEAPEQTAMAPVVNSDTPVIADVEPTYQASYLNNQSPAYPMLARRMRQQGKVVLNVEVLETGLCGQASVFQSSGYELLDNAALQAVLSWHFVPARQSGQAVTRWFKVPINFSLREG